MAAIDFPSSPTNGQVFTSGDKTWTYSTAVGAWRLQTQISAGATGATGATGTAATIAVGTVTTGAAGTSAIITNSGTSSAATFNFTIPRGDTGATGPTGPQGPAGTGDVTSTVTNTFTTNQIISGSTTAAMLRITQTGAGNALVVEDEANPDSTPFVVDASGNVGMGSSPASGHKATIRAISGGSTLSLRGGTTGTTMDSPYIAIWIDGDSNTIGGIGAKGQIGIGTVISNSALLRINSPITSGAAVPSGANVFNITSSIDTTVLNGLTTQGYNSAIGTTGTGTISSHTHILINQGTFAVGSTVTSQFGIQVGALSGAGSNYGIRSLLTSGANRWNLFVDGTAANYLAGRLGVGVQLTSGAMAQITNTTAADIGLIVQGAASQTGDLQRWQNSAGTVLMRVTAGGNIGIPTANTDVGLTVSKTITGGTTAYGVVVNGVVQSDVTSRADAFSSSINTTAASFTVSTFNHFVANGVPTFGAGSTVTEQMGFRVTGGLTGGTNNFAFRSSLAAGTNRWNLYMDGTAGNYLAGRLGVGATLSSGAMVQITNTTAADVALIVKGAAAQTGDLFDVQNSAGTSQFEINSAGLVGIGATPVTSISLKIGRQITGGINAYGMTNQGTIQSDVTSSGYAYYSGIGTAASTAISSVYHYAAIQGTFDATSTVTGQTGFFVSSGMTGATSNYGFRGQLASAAGRYNIFMDGSADNYVAGALGIGGFAAAGQTLYIARNATGATTVRPVFVQSTIQSDVTSNAQIFGTGVNTQAAAFNLDNLSHFVAGQGSVGAGSTIGNQNGFVASSSLTGATNNFGFRGAIPAGAGRFNLFMDGTANNHLNGRLGVGVQLTTGAMVRIDNTTASDVGLIAKGAVSQTADLQQWQNSAGSVVAKIDSTGAATITGTITSTNTNIILSDSGGQSFRSVRATAYTDNLNTRFFQVGVSSDSMFFTALNGTVASRIGFTGNRTLITSSFYLSAPPPSGTLHVLNGLNTTDKVLVVQGISSQSANLQEWQNSAGTVLAYVGADGSSSFYEGDQNIIAASIFS